MAFLSELTGRPVTDIDGSRIGVLKDLVARPIKGISHLVINAIVVRSPTGEDHTVPYSDLAALLSAAIPLNRPFKDIVPYESQDDDIRLVADVLDKQIL